MRLFRNLMQVIAIALFIVVAVLQFQRIDFDISQREKVEDVKLRDYVISYDLDYVKKELIVLQKDKWVTYVKHSNQARNSFIFLSLAVLAFGLSRLGRPQKRG